MCYMMIWVKAHYKGVKIVVTLYYFFKDPMFELQPCHYLNHVMFELQPCKYVLYDDLGESKMGIKESNKTIE